MIIEKELSYTIVGAALEVHNELGYGFHESVYVRSLAVVLQQRGVLVHREVPIKVIFRGVEVGHTGSTSSWRTGSSWKSNRWRECLSFSRNRYATTWLRLKRSLDS